MANEAGVMRSERVMLRALREVAVWLDEEYRIDWLEETRGAGDFDVWLAARLERDLEVKPAREGSLMTVQFTARDPAFAAQMANAVVRAYLDTTLDLRVEPAREFAQFFDERSRAARAALEAARRRLSDFERGNGIVASDERLDVETSRLAELSSQLTALQAAAAESGSRQRESGRHADVAPDVLSHPLVGPLRATLAQQEMQLLEMRARLTDDHPDIADLETRIAVTRARVRSESQRVVSSLGVAADVGRVRVEQAASALAAQRERVLQLKRERDSAAVLQREVESAQRAYDAVLARLEQSDLESRSRQTNVSTIKTASVPARPSSPRLGLNLAIAGVLGALLAAAAVYLRERGDRLMRTPDDVLHVLRQPLLGILPGSVPLAPPRRTRRPYAR